MRLIARRYLLVLWAILARPWTWLVLAWAIPMGGWALANLTGPGVTSRYQTVTLVASPPSRVAESLRALAQKGRLDTVTDFNMGAYDAPGVEGGFVLGSDGRLEVNPIEATRHQGDWKILDQLPALKRLWLPEGKSLTAEGWQRIGKHPSLEMLSMRLSSIPGGVPEAARAALRQLPRLRHLDVWAAGGEQDFLVPPLPALETITIDSRSVEENLRRLAAGSPRLATISLDPPKDFRFTRGMLESLKRMPNLKRLYIASFRATRNDATDRREFARLRAALPGVSVLPGVYCSNRVWAAVISAILLAAVPFAFWFQTVVLLGTPLGWMLPGRLAPHLFWPLAVSSVCGGLIVAMALSLEIAWTPAITLAVFSTLAITTTGRADVGGVADRISTATTALVLSIVAAAVATTLMAPWVVDRWLCGDMPLRGAAILLLVVGISAWQVARFARLPQIFARQGLVNPPGLVLGAAQWQQQSGSPWKASSRPFFSWSATGDAEGFSDRHSPHPTAKNSAHSLLRLLTGYGSIDDDIDQQIGRPVPVPFADMLRRPQSRGFLIAGPFFIGMGLLATLGLTRLFTQSVNGAPKLIGGWGIVVYVSLQQTLLMTVVLWGQRRDSLRAEFLRPVSRDDFWRGLRQAIARDLWRPAGLGAACLAMVVAQRETARVEPAIVAVALFCGWVAGTHAMLLLVAITRRPQIVTTLAAVLFIAAIVASSFTMALSVGALGTTLIGWRIEFLIAAAILAIGFTIRSAVLYRLEDREIG